MRKTHIENISRYSRHEVSKIGEDKVDFLTYNCLNDYLDDIQSKPSMTKNHRSHDIENDKDFSGVYDWGCFIQLMEEYDAMGINQRIGELDMVFQDVGRSNSKTYDVQGSYIDIGAYMSGTPECMVDFSTSLSKGGYASIYVNISERGGICNEEIAHKGLMVGALIDMLEHQGVRCSVYACTYALLKGIFNDIALCVKVKNEDELLNLSIFNTLHASFLRRGYFAMHEVLTNGDPISGYGRPMELTQEILSKLNSMFDNHNDNAILIPSLTHNSNLRSVCSTEDVKDSIEVIEAWIKEIDVSII